MRPIITFTVYGEPATQGSKRAMPIYRKGGVPVMKDGRLVTRVVNDNPRLNDWRHHVAAEAMKHFSGPLLEGAVLLRLEFQRPRPKGRPRPRRERL